MSTSGALNRIPLWTAEITLIFWFSLFCLTLVPHLSQSFPQGAPSDVCESFSPQRGHKAGPSPLEQCPYRLLQYGRHYRPGQLIGVEIISVDENGVEEDSSLNSNSTSSSFTGFLVQALKPKTLQFIGHFLPGEGLHLMPECSAVTHRNAKPKSAVGLLWRAPPRRTDTDTKGEVIFRATIVTTKTVFYQNLLAQVVDD